MEEFTTEELMEAIDRVVLQLLQEAGIDEPPVPTIDLLQHQFNYTIAFQEEEEDEDPHLARYKRPPRKQSRQLMLNPAQSDEGQSVAAARACAREMLPGILKRLGVVQGSDNRSVQNSLVSLIAPRLLLPGRWFEKSSRRANYDLIRIHEEFSTATFEMIAVRLLDFEDPMIISIVDDGAIALRKSNAFPVKRELVAAETDCLQKIQETEDPEKVRKDGWSVWGWPIPNGPFNRIILRSVPDEV